MHHAKSIRFVALLLAIGLIAAGCSDRRKSTETNTGGSTPGKVASGLIDTSKCPANGTTGVTGNTITFGASYPQSGLYAPFADVATGFKAYIKYINAEKGGVEIAGKKYQIKIKDKDDQYIASKTISNTQSLVTDDKVFGMFSVIGTANNIGIRDFLNQQCVPDLFAGTGSPAWGNTKYPWLIGSTLAPYSDEVKAFVDYLKQKKPNATVAILSATDDFGKAYLSTFESLIKGTKITVVKKDTYNPEDNKVDSQVTSLAATKADVLLAGATLLACPNTMKKLRTTGWNPIVYVSGTCAAPVLIAADGKGGKNSNGLLSSTNIKDPKNPKFANDPAMKLYRAKMKQYSPGADPTNAIIAYGWTQGALLEAALKNAKAATRSAVMESALTLDVKGIGLLLDGVSLHSAKGDKFLGEQFQLIQYGANKGYFDYVGGLVDYDGKTDSFTPSSITNG